MRRRLLAASNEDAVKPGLAPARAAALALLVAASAMLPIGADFAAAQQCTTDSTDTRGCAVIWPGPSQTTPQVPAEPILPPRIKVDSFVSAAWHRQSNDGWYASGFLTRERAEEEALKACNTAMGGGCAIAATNVNGAVVIARGTDGMLYAGAKSKVGAAQNAVEAMCRQQGDECVVVSSVVTKPGRARRGDWLQGGDEIFKPDGNPHRSYGAVAWVDRTLAGSGEEDQDLWIAGGKASAEEASAAALDYCRSDQPLACRVALVGSDGLYAVAHSQGKLVALGQGAIAGIAERRALEQCRKSGAACQVSGAYALGTAESVRFNPAVVSKPHHLSVAWTVGSDKAWGSKIWYVSGAATAKAAEDAALLACQTVSGQACKISASSFNGKAILFVDDKGQLRITSIAMTGNVEETVRRKCAAARVTCRVVKVIDSRHAGAEVVDAFP